LAEANYADNKNKFMKYILSLIVLISLNVSAQRTAYPLQNKVDVNKPDSLITNRVSGSGANTRFTVIPRVPYKDIVTPPPVNNQPPVVKTGADKVSTSSSVVLNGSGSSDPEGQPLTFSWIQTKGPAAILNTVDAVCTVTGLVTGEYTFQLTVTDNFNATATDTIHVSAKVGAPPPVNQSPSVNAGANQTITLPVSTVTLNGSATDADGTISSYQWTKLSGSGGSIASPNTAVTTVTGLTEGTYNFQLTATDNGGASASKTVVITVISTTPPPPPPTGYTLTFQTGYDTDADMKYGGNGQYGNGTISTSVYRTGPGAFYSRPANVSSGIRSEVQYSGSEQNNTEGAVEYDVMYEVVVPNNGHSFQWHPNTGGGSASPGLWHIGGKFVMVNWINGGNQEHPTGITIATNKWYHVRMEYKFASNGYFRFYLDGALAVGWTGQVGDGSGQYLKVGYNGWDGSSTSSRIYYDNLKIYKKQ
jgi:hypothetical protein